MKKVTFDNIKYINYNITQINQNIWYNYNDNKLYHMNVDFLREIRIISQLHKEEAKNNSKLKEALDKITVKTIDKLPEIRQDPDEYMKTISEVSRDPRDDKEIIKKIAKEVCIES